MRRRSSWRHETRYDASALEAWEAYFMDVDGESAESCQYTYIYIYILLYIYIYMYEWEFEDPKMEVPGTVAYKVIF